MKVLSYISFLFVTIFAFTAGAQAVNPSTDKVYTQEPQFDEKTGEIVSGQGFRYTGDAFQAPTYDPHVARPSMQLEDVSSEIEKIRTRGRVRCGSNMQVKSFAYKEDGVWHGVDADFCRVFALAILDDSEKIEMVNVAPNHVARALNENRIDVMLSGAGYVATMEASGNAVSAGVLYYDHQMVMIKDLEAENISQMKKKKICLSTDTDYYQNFDSYNIARGLEISYLSFDNLAKAKEAFLLNRCEMMTASGLMLNGILKELPKSKAIILQDYIALKPVYAFVQKDNNELRLAIKWILNALLLAEQHGINVKNMEYFATNDNPEIRNLLGDEENLWKSFNMNPKWVRKVIPLLGNYGDIYDRNLGEASDYHLPRKEGRLVKDGGTVQPIPFL